MIIRGNGFAYGLRHSQTGEKHFAYAFFDIELLVQDKPRML
jgi:hypothetical protein